MQAERSVSACSSDIRGCRNLRVFRKVDVRLPGKGNSDSHGARPIHLIITMIKWIRTSRLSINPKPSSSLLLSSLELSDTQAYEPYIRALLGTSHTVDFEGFVASDIRGLLDQICTT